jgi:integrase
LHQLPTCATKLCMKGTIRTKEKCPKCRGSFQESRLGLMCPNCDTEPKHYFVDFWWQGQRLKVYADRQGYPLTDYEQASRLLTVMRSEVDRNAFDPRLYASQSLKPLQFSNYLQSWLDRQCQRAEKGHISHEYVRKLTSYVRLYLVPCLGRFNIKDINEGHIEDFWLDLPNRLSMRSRQHILVTLQKVLNDALRRRDIGRVPEFPKVEVPEPEIRVIDEETQERILNQINCPIRRAFFLFLIRTGCRHNEARALRWERVDLEEGVAKIAAGMDGRIYRESTKEKNVRDVPLTDDLVEALRSLPSPLKPINYVFSLNGCPLTINMVWRTWDVACNAVGVKIPPYQGTRHSLATQLLNEGVSDKLIQGLLGHKTRDMMDRYAKLHITTLKETLQRRRRSIKKQAYAQGSSRKVEPERNSG